MQNAKFLLLPLFLLGCSVTANQPVPAMPPANFNPMASLAPLAEAVEPAVVNVYVTTVQENDLPPRWQMLLGVPGQREVKGQGSGFVISGDGFILTNNHVAENATDIKVKFSGGEEYKAKVVGTDPSSDVALLKIDAGKTLPFLQLGNSESAKVGDWVVAVGNPLGLGHTITAGIISGKERNISDQLFEEFLQTDASINPGNSGGPLITLDGKVVGMNTAIVSGANTVGFAIPSSYLSNVVEQLRDHGKVARGFLGVNMSSLSEEGKKLLGVNGGAVLMTVAPDGPAAKGGLKEGDVVLRIDGAAIEDQRDLLRAVAGKTPGTKVTVELLRQGKPSTVVVALGERPAQ